MSVSCTDPYAIGEDVFAGDHKDVPSLIAFDVLQMFGLVGMTLILVTVLVSPIITKRSPVWLNFVVSWIIATASNLCVFSLSLVPLFLKYAVEGSSWARALTMYQITSYASLRLFSSTQLLLCTYLASYYSPPS